MNLQQLLEASFVFSNHLHSRVYFLKGLSKSEDAQFIFTSEEAVNLHPGMYTRTCARILHVYPRIHINCPLSASSCYLVTPLSPSSDFFDIGVFYGSSIQL